MNPYHVVDLIRSDNLLLIGTYNNKKIYTPKQPLKIYIQIEGVTHEINTLIIQSNLCLVKWTSTKSVVEYEYGGEMMAVLFDDRILTNERELVSI
jgi:hypothetical protein